MAKNLSFDLDSLKAQFAANGGKIEKIELGLRAIESDAAIYKAMRDGGKVCADSVAMTRESESAFHRESDAYRAAQMDGWTRCNAAEYAAAARDAK